MAKIKFTTALERFFPSLKEMSVEGTTVKAVLNEIEVTYPGLSDYLLEEDGSLRRHVNIFLDQDMIRDRRSLSDEVSDEQEILIFQALSGG